jgi:phosphate transport system substrate-binding protein
LNINFNAVGSTAGRSFYIQKQVDFAVSEIPFQSAYRDSSGSVVTNELNLVASANRPFAYLPIVAGGTSFMYHLEIAGKRVTNLNLSPDTIAKMFTGQITVWNDPAIKATNPTVALPALPVRPVVRGDGSGTTAQFTAFLASQTPGVWNAFCQKVGLSSPCPATSLYPQSQGAVAQNLSDGVANYVAASYNNGAITYVEYGYAKERGYPVASVLNRAGKFTQPTAFNVTTALKGASLNADKTQNLGGVYTNGDPYTYPVSSYSYMIVPTSTSAPFSAAKGDVLRQFIGYFVCAGQSKAESLGYAPMPKNLRAAALDSAAKIPGTAKLPALNNAECPGVDAVAAPTPTTQPPTATSRPTGGQGSVTTQPQGGSGSATTNSGTGNNPSNGTVPVDPKTGEPVVTVIDPDTGKAVPAVRNNSGVYLQPIAAAQAITPPSDDSPISPLIVVATVLLLLAVIFVPPILSTTLSKRRRPVGAHQP